MSSNGHSYTPQQLAYIKAQQQQQARCPAQYQPQQQQQQLRLQSSAASSYPSPVSSNSSDASSPTYQSSPTLYNSQPPATNIRPQELPYRTSTTAHQPQPPRRTSTHSTSTHPQKDPTDNWYCFYQTHQPQSFARKADLKRHYDQVHNAAASRTYDCDFPGCHRRGPGQPPAGGFGRKDKLVEHLREVHGRDIPKRGGGERKEGR